MRALVTGAAGFIGSALSRRLVCAGAEVTGFDALTYAARRESLEPLLSRGEMTLVEGDIRDGTAVAAVFAQIRPTHVFHLAAETHVDRSIDDPSAFLSTNVTGTYILLQGARDFVSGLDAGARAAFRFVHVSTDEVFGALGETGQFTEDSAYAPRSPYAASKAASDHLVRAWHETYGLPVLITNCSNNLGPRQFPEKLVPLMVLKALAGERLPVFGQGLQVRDWLHVDDHASALLRVAEAGQPGATYLIGAEAERSNLDMVRQIAALMDERRPASAPHDSLIEFVDDRPGHDFRYAIDPSRIRSELGWAPSMDFDTALASTVDWYLANEDWWRPILEGTYGGERLGRRA